MLTKEQIARIIFDCDTTGHSKIEKASAEAAAEKIAAILEEDQNVVLTAAALENEVTSNLMDMLAGTILATLILEEGGGRTNISFSPNSMKETLNLFVITSVSDGLTRTVSITPKEGTDWQAATGQEVTAMTLDNALRYDTGKHSVIHDPDESTEGAKPQAEHKEHDRPVWTVRFMAEQDEGDRMGALLLCVDREHAERTVRGADPQLMATVENRCCLHLECPASGCTHPEATSSLTD